MQAAKPGSGLLKRQAWSRCGLMRYARVKQTFVASTTASEVSDISQSPTGTGSTMAWGYLAPNAGILPVACSHTVDTLTNSVVPDGMTVEHKRKDISKV